MLLTRLDVSQIFTCQTSKIMQFLRFAYIEYRRKLCSNPLAWLVVLLAPGCWAMGCVEHYQMHNTILYTSGMFLIIPVCVLNVIQSLKCYCQGLTHCGQTKCSTFCGHHFKFIRLYWNCYILIQNSQKFLPNVLIDSVRNNITTSWNTGPWTW